jgi:hypothetical protein
VAQEGFRNMIRLEARVAFVQKRAEHKKVMLSKDVALYLAQNVGSNASALEGALNCLKAHSSLLKAHPLLIGTDITLNHAKTILQNFISPRERTATVDPFQGMSFGQAGTKEANRTRQSAAAADRSPIFRRLETPEGRKIRRVREVLEVNMREYEREQLAGRDGYERELERRAKSASEGEAWEGPADQTVPDRR